MTDLEWFLVEQGNLAEGRIYIDFSALEAAVKRRSVLLYFSERSRFLRRVREEMWEELSRKKSNPSFAIDPNAHEAINLEDVAAFRPSEPTIVENSSWLLIKNRLSKKI